jgi:transglutaminase-like putative cysteine protease
MQKKTITILFSLIFLCFIGKTLIGQTNYTDEKINQLVRESPKFSDYPEAGAVILMQQVIHEINSDGSATTEEHILIKILRDRGKEKFGDLKRDYNVKTDSMVILIAQSRKRIGEPIPVEPEAINDITPPELENASIYADFHQKVISYPEVAPNICLELKYRTYHRKDSDSNQYFWGINSFQWDEPILTKEYVVIVPKAKKFKYTMTRRTLEPVVTEKGDKTIYLWRVENVDQIIPEPYMPPEIAPTLIYTSCPDWEHLGKWLNEQFTEKIETTPSITAKADELTTGLTNNEEKIKTIFLWLVTKVRNVQLPLGITGYKPHHAATVLENMYGDWRDKATLLVSLLKASKIEANIALVKRHGSQVTLDMPTPEQFNGIYVNINLSGGKTLWLNPFADDCRYGYLDAADGNRALVVNEGSGILTEIPHFSAEVNRTIVEGNITLAADGSVTATENFHTDGIFDFQMRRALKDKTPIELSQFFDQAATTLGEGTTIKERKLSDLEDLTATGEISWSYSSPDQGIIEGNMMIYHLPSLVFSFIQGAPYLPSLKERKYPFYIGRNCSYMSEYRFKLPKGYKIAYIPEKIDIENEFGKWVQEFQKDPNDPLSIIKKKTVSLKTQIIPIEKYNEYKKVYDEFVHRRNSIILLEKI